MTVKQIEQSDIVIQYAKTKKANRLMELLARRSLKMRLKHLQLQHIVKEQTYLSELVA